ncbi:vitamin B6 photo-protection and homoeostasis-domain-containing protein [Annulohypoxylon maeteangense]|uniref:vitamin B6 photo-protection and homoeostasis-domain-containing protein n=1 Tax=Annulohypoxylon maeteangense TaxID=1927788 RepID=UPI0020079D98|nr:vitamin B6 photo-protection and homoeostasis-domain-containing protein [Annulohypoxylon maeteangense]KAI0884940.1 vitamin B6 photo-protection and homoeostasis-domain-containing protein [Annulohypoxylon maeteangense]
MPPRLLEACNDSGASQTYDENGKPLVPKTIQNYAAELMDVFLPVGYPDSVTADYTPYQVYDSLQAFSSTIAGLLSSRAVLQGFGVGESGSSATAAVLLTVLQESTGRLATILFAHRCGQAIQPECKFYRFLADIVNDAALFLDVLAPALPTYPKVLALCAAGILRALCGISGGAAKAELSAHFAKNGNLAELNAKDGSQETVISLLGMLVGSVFLKFVHGRNAVLAWMVILVSIHLWTNYRAVRSVQMRTLNKQRLTIMLKELNAHRARVPDGMVDWLHPNEIAAKESILFWSKPKISFADRLPEDGDITPDDLSEFTNVPYVIVTRNEHKTIWLKQHAKDIDVITAWAQACSQQPYIPSIWYRSLKRAGWDVQTNALETGSRIRIVVDEGSGSGDEENKKEI